MEEAKKGKWAILVAMMAFTYLSVRWLGRWIPYAIAPLTIFAKFLTDLYSDQLGKLETWVRLHIQQLRYLLTRRRYERVYA